MSNPQTAIFAEGSTKRYHLEYNIRPEATLASLKVALQVAISAHCEEVIHGHVHFIFIIISKL